MQRKFYTLDVFTDKALSGNPLAVVLDAEGLDTQRMQAIAAEFNLAETVFVLPTRDNINTARIRIFTPKAELPFAGHPTVGTAILIAGLRAPELLARQDVGVVLEENIGNVSCTVRHIKGKAARASFVLPRLPEQLGAAGDVAAIAAALSLKPEDIGFDDHVPSVFSAGVPFAFVPLKSLNACARARPDMQHWAGAIKSGERANAFVYTREVAEMGHAFHVRMFAPGLGIAEDPATGAAAAAFSGVVMHFDQPGDGDHTLVIEQGFEMGRPSLITLGLDVSGGVLTSASIAGSAVIVSQGTIDL